MNFKKGLFFIVFLCSSFLIAQNTSKHISYSNAVEFTKTADLQHTKLEVSFDIPNELLFGKAWITVSPHFYETAKLVLDAKAMLIESVLLGSKKLPFYYDGEQLFIDLDKTYSKDESVTVFIKYTAQPNKVKQKGSNAITDAKGLYFINPKGEIADKPTQIWTQGETEASSCWFPTIDKPNQKSTQEISITVPNKYQTLSNGQLVSQTNNEGGTRTDYWKMDQKHAPYLFFMGIGEFAIVKDQWRGKEVSYYVEKDKEHLARKIFGNTPEMMDFFSKITGVDYVWNKYAQMVGRDYVSGAMENTTAVLHGESAYQAEGDLLDENSWEPVIAHELFHHWFGDLVTSENWSNLSLNESFANYSEYLWIEYKYGADKANAHLQKEIDGYKKGDNYSKHLVRFDYADKEDMFDAVSYNKGGLILHMLRNYIGDKAFFASLKKYLTDYQYGTAEAHQLRTVFEDVSGKDLNWFFNQWYFGSGHPTVNISFDYDVLAKTVNVNLKQSSSDVFFFPLKIEVYENGKFESKTIFVDAAEKSVKFSYKKNIEWINVNADHVILGDFVQNKSLANYIHQYQYASHYIDRKEAVEQLIKNQDNKEAFGLLVTAFNDAFDEIQVLAIENIDLVNKNAKKGVIEKIEYLARNSKNNKVKAAAIKVMGKLVNPNYQSFFVNAFESPSNAIKASALEGLFYLNNDLAMAKAKKLSNSVKETIAFPLVKMYIKQKDETEMDFIAKYLMQGMFLTQDKETNTLFKDAFQWVVKSNNIKAYQLLVDDMVAKGTQFKKYNFHLEVIKMLRGMVSQQDKLNNSNKEELTNIVRQGLLKLIDVK